MATKMDPQIAENVKTGVSALISEVERLEEMVRLYEEAGCFVIWIDGKMMVEVRSKAQEF